MDDRLAKRRERILATARHLALRHGLKGVTMEAIAREAGIAKPTLYGHFTSKEDVFVAVMEALIAEMTAAFDGALQRPGDAIDRVSAALAGKHAVAMQLLEGSPHADELYGAHDRVAGPQFRALEAMIQERLTDVLSRHQVPDPSEATRLLMAATQGVALNARSVEDLKVGIDIITRRYLEPELGQGQTPARAGRAS